MSRILSSRSSSSREKLESKLEMVRSKFSLDTSWSTCSDTTCQVQWTWVDRALRTNYPSVAVNIKPHNQEFFNAMRSDLFYFTFRQQPKSKRKKNAGCRYTDDYLSIPLFNEHKAITFEMQVH